jgi:hypothetical protein
VIAASKRAVLVVPFADTLKGAGAMRLPIVAYHATLLMQ